MRTLPIRPEAGRASGPAKLLFALIVCVALAQGCSLLKGGHETQTNFSVKPDAKTGRFHKSDPDEGVAERGEGKEDDAKADRAETANSMAAKLTAAQAKAAALAVQPGTATRMELEDENGVRVYSVHITAAGGQRFEVKVDANSGKVLNREPDNDAEPGSGGEAGR